MPITTSPSWHQFFSCSLKTWSYPMSLATPVKSDTESFRHMVRKRLAETTLSFASELMLCLAMSLIMCAAVLP